MPPFLLAFFVPCNWKRIVLLGLSAASLLLPARSAAQSVADAAREARDRVAKGGSKPTKVVTNDDFDHRAPAGSTVQLFPTVRASFHPPDNWGMGGTTDFSVIFLCPGTTHADECFIVIKNWTEERPTQDWEARCLQDNSVREPLSGPGVLELEPWHGLSVRQFHARQTILETGLDLANTKPDRHERRKYLLLADPGTQCCYSLDAYVPVARADEYIAAYDELVASFLPVPPMQQQKASDAPNKQ